MGTEKLVGQLAFVDIRTLFPHEAQGFTTWLEEHIDALADRLGIELTVVEREKAVGDFNVDLLCEDGDGRPVIIENQLERTDHDHLGKLLTYLVNLDAKAAIWVTPEPRLEHRKVIDWLNEFTPEDMSFYLVKVEAVKIGDSPAAPLFTMLAMPDMQGRVVGEEKKEWAELSEKRREFWESLLQRAEGKIPPPANDAGLHSAWLSLNSVATNTTFHFIIRKNDASVNLYIGYDQFKTGEKNKAIFDALHDRKDEIERAFGEPLEWQRMDDKQASRICKTITGGGLADPESWPELQDRMIETMIRFERALRPHLDEVFKTIT